MSKNIGIEEDCIHEDTIKNKYLSFYIDKEEFGIEICYVKEIINMVSITKVPSTPNYIKGIINLRGDIIPVIDVRIRFMMEEKEYNDLTCIVVIEYNDSSIGLIVDSVNEVKFIKEKNISLPPSAKLSYTNQFIKNLGRSEEKVLLLIEIEKLLYEE